MTARESGSCRGAFLTGIATAREAGREPEAHGVTADADRTHGPATVAGLAVAARCQPRSAWRRRGARRALGADATVATALAIGAAVVFLAGAAGGPL